MTRMIRVRKTEPVIISDIRLAQAIFDSVVAKRQIKVGYVGPVGGLHPHQCDTVGAHNYAVAILATEMAYELQQPLLEHTGVQVDFEVLMRLALFHDFGETRSLDTGAQAHALYDEGEEDRPRRCQIRTAERRGLQRNVEGLKIAPLVMKDFDNYMRRDSPEAIIVGVCDALEGFEKAFHTSTQIPGIVDTAFRILGENIALYGGKTDETLRKVGQFLVDILLLPGAQKIVDAYLGEKQIDVKKRVKKYVTSAAPDAEGM